MPTWRGTRERLGIWSLHRGVTRFSIVMLKVSDVQPSLSTRSRNCVKLSRTHQSWRLRQATWFAAACVWLNTGVAPRASLVDSVPPQGPDSRGTLGTEAQNRSRLPVDSGLTTQGVDLEDHWVYHDCQPHDQTTSCQTCSDLLLRSQTPCGHRPRRGHHVLSPKSLQQKQDLFPAGKACHCPGLTIGKQR